MMNGIVVTSDIYFLYKFTESMRICRDVMRGRCVCKHTMQPFGNTMHVTNLDHHVHYCRPHNEYLGHLIRCRYKRLYEWMQPLGAAECFIGPGQSSTDKLLLLFSITVYYDLTTLSTIVILNMLIYNRSIVPVPGARGVRSFECGHTSRFLSRQYINRYSE